MREEVLLAYSTFADADTARKVARTLVEERLVACANIVPQVESIYRWKSAVETAAEALVIFKTTHGRYQQFEQRLRELHPYEVPEIIAIQPRDGLFSYMNWVVESCGEA